jgi:hypothetical protein
MVKIPAQDDLFGMGVGSELGTWDRRILNIGLMMGILAMSSGRQELATTITIIIVDEVRETVRGAIESG